METGLQSKSMDWFLYDRNLRHERVKIFFQLTLVILLYSILNLLLANGPILYTLKTLENQGFSSAIRGYKMRTLAKNR